FSLISAAQGFVVLVGDHQPLRVLTSGRQARCVAGQMGGLVLAVSFVFKELVVNSPDQYPHFQYLQQAEG
ncbi:hypothetical protein, partial [Pseudomonas amygdali]|uniref:hypothetical protein n=1 Tax=Pseudomonas amygdali TaxID=47877 RepID=UPI001C7E7637